MWIIRLLSGSLLLSMGRKLFWLFLASIGFFVAMDLAVRFFQRQPDFIVILIALAAGVVGALIAVFLQGVAIWFAGFFGGGYLALSLMALFGFHSNTVEWILFIVGGIIGGIMLAVLFDWALIVLSALSGATLVIQALNLKGGFAALIFLLLIMLGISIQSKALQKERKVTQ